MITWSIGLLFVILLIALGLPIAFSMMIVGFIGLNFIIGIEPTLSMVGQVFFDDCAAGAAVGAGATIIDDQTK